ncbi:fimbrial protein [Mixta calida]|uniref:fimbrial protein n=1 Tax=Mixta calida TaxID=665913 RepID=UPI0028987D0D|nr:fimbrial protein [Mixta calida]
MKKLTGAAGGMMLVAMLPASGWAAGCDIDATRTQRVTLPDLLIDPNLPPGSVIGSKIVSLAGAAAQRCSGSISYQSMMTGSWSRPSGVLPDVYETGVPGVGVKISDYLFSDRSVPVSETLTPNPNAPLPGFDIQLLFYRIGDITPGSFPGGEVARFTLPDSSGNAAVALSLQAASGSVRMKSCYAKSPNLIVQLGSVNRRTFVGMGSTVTPTAFNVELICQGDLPVNVSFSTASGTSSPEPGIVPIENGEGSASGVAVKVMHRDGSPLRFDTPQPYHLNGEPEIKIPLLATMTPVGNRITPGKVRATMTFTITQN